MMTASSSSSEENRHIKKRRSDPNPTKTRPDSEPRRSLRPRQTRYLADLEDEADLDEEEIERGARERSRLKAPVKLLPSSSPRTMPRSRKLKKVDFKRRTSMLEESTSSEDDEVKTCKRFGGDEDNFEDGSSHREGSKKNVTKKTIRAVSGTPMPEKSVLKSILDKLQKKDTYGVFAEPVDPDELPDYHDVIDHPMDFGTVRKKLASGRYLTFEQFEDDVFLICSNAMQYNAPDTIYFRQAHSIQDMARKNFQEIRTDLISNRIERNHGQKERSASPEKKIVNRVSCFNPSFIERKSRWHPHNRAAPKSVASDYSNLDNKPLRTQFRIDPKVRSLDRSLHEKKTFKKPQPKTSSNISPLAQRTVNKPQIRSALRSDVSFSERMPLKKTQHNLSLEPLSSRKSSTEKNAMTKMVKYKSLGNVSSVEKKRPKTPQYVSESDGSESSDSESTSEDHSLSNSDTSSLEKTRLKEPQRSRNEPELSDTGMCSPDKKTVIDPLCSDISSGAVLAPAVDTELCKILVNDELNTVKSSGLKRSMPNESSDGISLDESKTEREDDIPAKPSPSESEQELSTVDINRRATYDALDEQPSVDTDSLNVFSDEEKELISVVPHDSEYAYARSLARFAGSLGPVAWEVASRKIKQVLPPGVKFGAGWVDEVEPLLSPIIYSEKQGTSLGSNKNEGHETAHEGRDRTREQRSGLFHFKHEQPSSGNQNLQSAKNHPKPNFPSNISQGWNQVQKPQQQKNQAPSTNADSLTKINANEPSRHQPMVLYPQASSQMNNNSNGFTMNIGASNNWRSIDNNSNNRLSYPFGFISDHQTQPQPQFWPPRPVPNIQNSIHKNPNANSTSSIHECAKASQESKGVVMFPQSMDKNNISGLRSSWQGLVPHNKKKDLLPPDLNISFQPPESPAHSSTIRIESQQPDLALQL